MPPVKRFSPKTKVDNFLQFLKLKGIELFNLLNPASNFSSLLQFAS
uniref:Uncharacterized protein n=1 Tax=Rhizophora mucronata TaxID=61149 RepID=A0A2P2QMG6_RHIMU